MSAHEFNLGKKKFKMLEFLGLGTSSITSPFTFKWACVLIVFVVLWLVKIVTDIRGSQTLSEQSSRHFVTNNTLTQFCSHNNKQLLIRLRDSIHRANVKTGNTSVAHRQLVTELDVEINSLVGSFGSDDPNDNEDEYDDAEEEEEGDAEEDEDEYSTAKH